MKTLILFSALLLALSSCSKTMPVPDSGYDQVYIPDDGYDDGDDGNYPPDDGSDDGSDDSDNGSDNGSGDDGGQSGCAINQHHSVTTGTLRATSAVRPVQ